MKKILMVLGVVAFTASNAHAVLKVNVLGGMNFADSSISGTAASTQVSPKAALSYGATVQFPMLPMFDLEAGILSVGKKSKFEAAGLAYTGSTRGWEIPVMLRFTMLPIVDFGAGVYYAMLGDEVEVTESNTALIPNGKRAVDKTTNETTDIGAKLSARARMPIAPLTDFLVDLSYNYGLKDLDKDPTAPNDTQKTRDYALMAGIAFGF